MQAEKIYLVSEDPSTNTRKHYIVAFRPTIGNSWEVLTAWGRIGGSTRSEPPERHANYHLAKHAYTRIVQAKLKKGYAIKSPLSQRGSVGGLPDWYWDLDLIQSVPEPAAPGPLKTLEKLAEMWGATETRKTMTSVFYDVMGNGAKATPKPKTPEEEFAEVLNERKSKAGWDI